MDYFTIGAIVWLVVFLLLGLLKGFWKSLAAATSLILAYFASVYFASGVTEFLMDKFSSLKMGRTVWWIIATTAIFIAVSLIARLIVLAVGRSLPVINRFFDRVAGGAISVGYGSLLGAVLLWGLAFLADSWNLRQERAGEGGASRIDTSSPAVAWSRYIMSHWVNWNVKQSGGSDALAGMSAAIVESPAKVLADVQATVRSAEFKQLVQSEQVQQIVGRRDSEALQRSPEFQQLLQQPAMKELRNVIAPESSGWSEEKIARETVDIWTRVEQLKTRPEVAGLLNDPEVQSFLQGGGKISPSLISKGQELLTLLSGDISGAENLEVPRLYQWHDDDGDLHVTDEKNIPADKRSSAVPLDF